MPDFSREWFGLLSGVSYLTVGKRAESACFRGTGVIGRSSCPSPLMLEFKDRLEPSLEEDFFLLYFIKLAISFACYSLWRSSISLYPLISSSFDWIASSPLLISALRISIWSFWRSSSPNSFNSLDLNSRSSSFNAFSILAKCSSLSLASSSLYLKRSSIFFE